MLRRAIPNILGAQGNNASEDPRPGPVPPLFRSSFLQCKRPFMQMCGHPNSQVQVMINKIWPPGLTIYPHANSSLLVSPHTGGNTIQLLEVGSGLFGEEILGTYLSWMWSREQDPNAPILLAHTKARGTEKGWPCQRTVLIQGHF